MAAQVECFRAARTKVDQRAFFGLERSQLLQEPATRLQSSQSQWRILVASLFVAHSQFCSLRSLLQESVEHRRWKGALSIDE